jgi:hypothetical protein
LTQDFVNQSFFEKQAQAIRGFHDSYSAPIGGAFLAPALVMSNPGSIKLGENVVDPGFQALPFH